MRTHQSGCSALQGRIWLRGAGRSSSHVPAGKVVFPGHRNVNAKVDISRDRVGTVEIIEFDNHRDSFGGVALVWNHLQVGGDRGSVAIFHDLEALQDLAVESISDRLGKAREGEGLRVPESV